MVQKELRKLSQWFWKGFLKWYDGGGENGITSKRIFEVEVFFLLLKYWLPLLFEETLEAFLFSFSFFYIWSVSWGLRGFDDIWGEDHFFKNFFSNGLTWNSTVMTMDIPVVEHIPKWSYACQYGWTMIMEMGELWIYQWWMHLPEWRYARQYFWVRLANNIFLGRKSFKKNSKLKWTHPLTKLNVDKSCYVYNIRCSLGLLCCLHTSSPVNARRSCEAVACLSHPIKQ
jgi:hypothetical protein